MAGALLRLRLLLQYPLILCSARPSPQLMPSGGGSEAGAAGALRAVGKGPVKSPDTMTFFARVGAPLRGIAAYAATEGPASAARTGPQLLFAFCGIDNSLALVNALTLRELWRARGLAICGLAAVAPVGVVNSLARYAHKHATKSGVKGTGARFELAGDRGTLLHATTRFLRRGTVVDPRTKALIVNGLPGRSTLQVGGVPACAAGLARRPQLVCPLPSSSGCSGSTRARTLTWLKSK